MKRNVKILMVVLSLCTLSCGGNKKKDNTKEKVMLKAPSASKKESSSDVNIAISGNDLMQFDKKELRVKAGQKVTLTLKHTGKIAVNVMGHNVVILNKGVDVNAFASKAAMAKDTNYIPQDALGDIIAYTDLIGGGQITSVTFNAPAVGTYDYICSFPGHVALMKGTFIVE